MKYSDINYARLNVRCPAVQCPSVNFLKIAYFRIHAMLKRLPGVVNNLLKLSYVNMLSVDIHNFSQAKEGLCSPLLEHTNPMGQF